MALKFVVLFAFIAVASAGFLPALDKTIVQPVLAKADDEYNPHPQDKLAYDVEDVTSGKSKRQVENCVDGLGDVSKYTVYGTDGICRWVQYKPNPNLKVVFEAASPAPVVKDNPIA